MGKPRIRRPSPVGPSPSPQEQSPRPTSVFDECPVLEPVASRPVSGSYSTSSSSSQYAMVNKPPSLKDILIDAAPPPWTLSAFMAYLSQNHCMETLEFTLDAQRYATFYKQFDAEKPPSDESKERVCGWWRKLMQTYIVPCAPREVNMPARVRDRLLALPPGPSPPLPSELDEAGHIIYELMNDSLLVPFLESVSSPSQAGWTEERARSPRHRSQHSGGRAAGQASRSTTLEADDLTDDSDANTPLAQEPMTPPTTPPTIEYSFNNSPGGFQRAVAAHSKGWKKVGAKLGLKAFSRRSTPSTSSAECDAPVA